MHVYFLKIVNKFNISWFIDFYRTLWDLNDCLFAYVLFTHIKILSLMIYACLGDGNASRGQLLSSCMGEWIWRKDNDKARVLTCSLSLMCFSLSLNYISFY